MNRSRMANASLSSVLAPKSIAPRARLDTLVPVLARVRYFMLLLLRWYEESRAASARGKSRVSGLVVADVPRQLAVGVGLGEQQPGLGLDRLDCVGAGDEPKRRLVLAG